MAAQPWLGATKWCGASSNGKGNAYDISVNHLYAVFKQTMDQSVHQFVIQQRIEKAKQLLKNSNQSLAAIAQDTGFSNQSHFTTSFRKALGVTPSQYRQEVRSL